MLREHICLSRISDFVIYIEEEEQEEEEEEEEEEEYFI